MWALQVFYESLCSLLRGGVHFQLRWNGLLRGCFGLGPPAHSALSKADHKLSKAELVRPHFISPLLR